MTGAHTFPYVVPCRLEVQVQDLRKEAPPVGREGCLFKDNDICKTSHAESFPWVKNDQS